MNIEVAVLKSMSRKFDRQCQHIKEHFFLNHAYELKSAWLGAMLKLATNDSKLRNRFDLKHPEYATTIVEFSSQTECKIGVYRTDPKNEVRNEDLR